MEGLPLGAPAGLPTGLPGLFGATQPAPGLAGLPPVVPPIMSPPPVLPPGLPPGMPPEQLGHVLAQLAGAQAQLGGTQPLGGLPGLPPGGLPPGGLPPGGLPPGGLPGGGLLGGLDLGGGAAAALLGGLPGMGDSGSNPMLQALLAQQPAGPCGGEGGGPDRPTAGRDADARANEERQHAERRRRGEASAQAELREKLAAAERVKCHLHKKPKAGCKFCAKHQGALEAAQRKPEQAGDDRRDRRRGRRPDRAISEDRDDRRGPLELANPKTFGLSGLLQTHIQECAHYKSLLTLETFDQVVDETFQFANAVEPYMANSGTLPSALFCCLYRFFTLGLDRRMLRRLMDNQESPFIRCVGFLYVRFGLPHDQVLSWLGEYILDDEEFKPSADSETRQTIGEFVEALLSQDRFYNTVLPRLPMVTKRAVEEKLAPLGQNRRRLQANKGIIDRYRDQGARVEASIGGEWLPGTVVELDEERPNRPMVRVRLEDGGEEYVLLGKVILSGSRGGRDRSRSPRGRGGGDRTDWSREKGRSDKELLEEMRSREREKAVCSTGKDYARRPVGYKAACALPREQGTASFRLMEEETFVPMSRGKRTDSPSPERARAPVRQSAEHQARMQQLFEKYGNVKAASEATRQSDGVDRPEVMRLG